MKKVLTIAGSDCSGGAGIQADLKTMTAHGVYGMSVITALTAQNTTGVYGILEAGAEFVAQQLDCVFTDIVPDAVKIGMVSSAELVRAIARKLREYGARHVVLDPVMVATSGGKLMADGTVRALVDELFPLAEVVTPNLPEAECLCGHGIASRDGMEAAAREIARLGCGAVLVKGGHLTGAADDLLLCGGEAHWFSAPRVDTQNTHGTGCTLSSAIACNLAMGCSVPQSVERAKQYLTGALGAGLCLGHGNGPVDHCYALRQDGRR